MCLLLPWLTLSFFQFLFLSAWLCQNGLPLLLNSTWAFWAFPAAVSCQSWSKFENFSLYVFTYLSVALAFLPNSENRVSLVSVSSQIDLLTSHFLSLLPAPCSFLIFVIVFSSVFLISRDPSLGLILLCLIWANLSSELFVTDTIFQF